MIKIGVIGYGYWGPNLVRNFANQKNCIVSKVADASVSRLELLALRYPNVKGVNTAKDILEDVNIDAVVIATPVFTHFQLAKKALENGKHVLLEKPMTSSAAEAKELIALADAKGKVIMVDHTFLYTGSVQKIKELIDDGTLGNLKYLDSSRINLGLFQSDVNVLWDLAPHDISICSYLMNERPIAVQAVGVSHTENGLENIAYLTLFYKNERIAHFNCSWISPVKIRQMLIGGDNKMLVWNDLETTEKIKIYDTGYKVRSESDRKKILVDYRIGDIYVPKVAQKEALSGMAGDFLSAILNNTTPLSHRDQGLEVVEILEAASISIKNKGQRINL